MDARGLEAVFLANRAALLRFLRVHGVGEAAEDLLQELWLKLSEARPGPIAQPLAYLYRAANNLMLDRYRSERQAARRASDWTEATGPAYPGRSDAPSGERVLLARERLGQVRAALAELGPRVERIFPRHRLDGVAQHAIATELGISLSTVESDLRKATRALVALRQSLAKDSPE
jgi:RNA polymerase sigma-70 factor (ECF subfamily)